MSNTKQPMPAPEMPFPGMPITGSWDGDVVFWHKQMNDAHKLWREALKKRKESKC